MKKTTLFSILALFFLTNSFAQDTNETSSSKLSFYIGYDLGEMALNRFQNFAGETGIRFKNDQTIRFVYLNIKLTEQHLSSNWITAVDGDHVKGHWHGFELLYDIPLFRFKKRHNFIYGGVSAGYHRNHYQHTLLPASLKHKTATVGIDLGYRETNLFNVKGLYFNFQIPIRYFFNRLEETKLDDTTVNKVIVEQTISFFVGYEF